MANSPSPQEPSTDRAPPHGLPIGALVKDVLKIAYRARRPILLEGPTGIGKSEIIRSVSEELGIAQVVLDLSLLEPPDLVGLPILVDQRTTYACPKLLPTNGAGILLLEELNRAERYIQQPALQLLTTRRLHEYVLPEGWLACAAINPEDGEYQVTPLDPALRARFLNLRVRADRPSWLDWAEAHGIHPAILTLGRTHDRFLDETPPRTWTYVSQLLQTLTPHEYRNEPLVRATLGGYLPPAWIEILLDILDRQGADETMPLLSLVSQYHRDLDLQRLIGDYRVNGQTDVLETLGYRLLQLVEGPELQRAVQTKQFVLQSFERLLEDLPGDFREQVQDAFGQNPAAGQLVPVELSKILHGYVRGPLRAQIQAWSSDAYRQHRLRVLVGEVIRQLEGHADLAGLRKNQEALTGLGALLDDVGSAGELLRKTYARLKLPLGPGKK